MSVCQSSVAGEVEHPCCESQTDKQYTPGCSCGLDTNHDVRWRGEPLQNSDLVCRLARPVSHGKFINDMCLTSHSKMPAASPFSASCIEYLRQGGVEGILGNTARTRTE